MRFRAVLFDCDGVLVHSEPAHCEAFRATLAAEGLPLTLEDYFRRYLAEADAVLPGLDGLSVADVERLLDLKA